MAKVEMRVIFLYCALVSLPVGSAVASGLSLLGDFVGSIEVANGTFKSIAFNRSFGYRVLSPENPSWPPPYNHTDVDIGSDGMRVVIYVMNLTGVPRPSEATDTEIIQDLIQGGFLVAAVDYEGAHIGDLLDFLKDINKLFYVFGATQCRTRGTINFEQLMGMRNRSWNDEKFYTSFPFPGNASKRIPINMGAIYVIPSGYTVEPQVIIEEGFVIGKSWPPCGGSPACLPNATNVTKLFVDIIFPKASPRSERVPLVLEGSVAPQGDFVITHFTVTLFPWLFSGYALASMNYVYMDPRTTHYVDDTAFTQAHTIQYLRAHSERFSLSGKVGATGVSKSNLRCYVESNARSPNTTTTAGPVEFSNVSKVDVTMPAVGYFGDKRIWDHLDNHSAPLVLTKGTTRFGLNGTQIEQLRDDYLAAGLEDRLLYFDEPMAGHEYNVYHLKEIMAFFDRFCKSTPVRSESIGKSSLSARGE